MNRIEELEAEVARLRERVAALEEELGFAMMIAEETRRADHARRRNEMLRIV